MCFRPAEATAPQICPECGAEIAVIAGIRQKNCPFCNAVLPAEEPAAKAAAGAAPAMAPSAPATPTAPSAPSAPAAPAAPAPTSSEQAAAKPASPTPAPASQDNKPFNPFDR